MMSDDAASLRVLVVDDNEDIRHLLVLTVERMGHHADQAADGVAAVEALGVGRYDVMLLDLTMPRMTGEDVLRWLREQPSSAAGLRVVVISAYAGALVETLKELGAYAVLTKPIGMQELREVLDETPAPRGGVDE